MMKKKNTVRPKEYIRDSLMLRLTQVFFFFVFFFFSGEIYESVTRS
jgi:hypothetical protein